MEIKASLSRPTDYIILVTTSCNFAGNTWVMAMLYRKYDDVTSPEHVGFMAKLRDSGSAEVVPHGETGNDLTTETPNEKAESCLMP